MKARVKYYDDLYDAVDDEDGHTVTVYGDDKVSLLKSVYAISDKYLVTNVFIDESEKKEQNA